MHIRVHTGESECIWLELGSASKSTTQLWIHQLESLFFSQWFPW